MKPSHRLFAVIPAAGRSRRMGRPKLLLPLAGKSVVVRLLERLGRPEIAETFVVVRPDDDELSAEAASTGATVIQPPVPPPDMRASVEWALNAIRARHAPTSGDGWLLVPADHPVLDAQVLDQLIERWNSLLEAEAGAVGNQPANSATPAILVPTCGTRRGHPTFFRWELADEVARIPAGRGLNWLVQTHADRICEVPIDNPAVLTDLDTPEDYERLLRTFERGGGNSN